MSAAERDEGVVPKCFVFRFCTSTFRRSLLLVLVTAVLLDALDVFKNWRDVFKTQQNDLRRETTTKSPPLSRPWQPHPRILFLDSQGRAFSLDDGVKDPVKQRTVDDLWGGSRDPKHKFHYSVDILYHPVTLKGEEGQDVCDAAADWQERFYPTCNTFHEMVFHPGTSDSDPDDEATTKKKKKRNRKVQVTDGVLMDYLGSGKSRDAWKVSKNREAVVLKTLKVDHIFSPEIYHHQRIDAVASERLTGSPHVIDIYGFCGASVMNELGVEYGENETLSLEEKLRYSRDIAAGMADMHSIDGAKNAMVVHADVRRGNVMFTMDRSVLKLSDFNRGFYLGWNTKEDEPCAVQRPRIRRTPRRDKFSAPEETYRQVLTEKSDVYHLGGMLFYILTGKRPYSFNDKSELTSSGDPQLTDEWGFPTFPTSIKKSRDPAIVAMRKAIKACLRYSKEDRASAKDIYKILNKAMASRASL